MINNLPKKPLLYECAVVNFQKESEPGTHWVSYKKLRDVIFYFDSFGNLKPPLKLQEYFAGNKVFYNREVYQKLNEQNCGQNCVKFLKGTLKCPLQ